MYQARRSQKVTEDVELIREDGSVYKTLHIDLDACSIAERVNEKYIDLVHAQQETQGLKAGITDPETMAQAYDKLGNAVINVFKVVFGERNTADIVKFYDDRYTEMCTELLPFVTGVVIPKIREAASESRAKIMQGYNRRQRRQLFKDVR